MNNRIPEKDFKARVKKFRANIRAAGLGARIRRVPEKPHAGKE